MSGFPTDKPVLIIDDNDAVCTALQVLLELHDIPAITAATPEEGLAVIRDRPIGVVIQDMNFTEDGVSGEEGVRLFRQLRKADPLLPVLLITAWTSLETAVQLVKEGAHDYLGKPWDDAKLVREVSQLLKMRSAGDLAQSAADRKDIRLEGMVFADAAMARLVQTSVQVADSDVPILITGPNGSGKEMLAQLIQANSPRRSGPFVKVNAGALPSELLESELFGVEPGAFTGAQKKRLGRFEEAHKGTLFLDEIGNLPLAGQIKLLRVLQSGEFSRLGSNKVINADVRIISATNVDLLQAIDEGRFREDLYFRLNVVELAVPSLAARSGDILPLARHFFKTLSGAEGKRMSPEFERVLLAHSWPGNVRELRNRLHRAVLVAAGPVVRPSDLGLPGGAPETASSLSVEETQGEGDGEKRKIRQALNDAGGNISQAATTLNMSRQALYRRMEKHGIVWERRLKG